MQVRGQSRKWTIGWLLLWMENRGLVRTGLLFWSIVVWWFRVVRVVCSAHFVFKFWICIWKAILTCGGLFLLLSVCCFHSLLPTEKRKTSLLDQLTNTSGTVIGVTSCIVIILIIVSVIVQIKQPRKKYVQRKSDFDQTVFQEVFEPPHYELCTLRGTGATADFADDFENYHKLRRSSSKCIHDHHCGSQLSSAKGSRSNLSTRDASILAEIPTQPVKPLIPPVNRRNILVMKHNYSQDAADACDIDEIEEVPTTSHRLSRHEKSVQRSVSVDIWWQPLTEDGNAPTALCSSLSSCPVPNWMIVEASVLISPSFSS